MRIPIKRQCRQRVFQVGVSYNRRGYFRSPATNQRPLVATSRRYNCDKCHIPALGRWLLCPAVACRGAGSRRLRRHQHTTGSSPPRGGRRFRWYRPGPDLPTRPALFAPPCCIPVAERKGFLQHPGRVHDLLWRTRLAYPFGGQGIFGLPTLLAKPQAPERTTERPPSAHQLARNDQVLRVYQAWAVVFAETNFLWYPIRQSGWLDQALPNRQSTGRATAFPAPGVISFSPALACRVIAVIGNVGRRSHRCQSWLPQIGQSPVGALAYPL